MYLLDCGVFDAKGVLHPTVVGMQLRRQYPRHRVVGAAWQHAQEWVRANMTEICTTYNEHGDIDLKRSLGLPAECFPLESPLTVGEPMWTQTFPKLGEAQHAFPRTTFRVASFERVANERQHLTCCTDGDHAMSVHMREELGQGKSGVRHIDACSFHQLATLKKMIDGSIIESRRKRARNPKRWDRRHPAGKRLEEQFGGSFLRHYGGLADVCMQHDVHAVAELAWDLILDEAYYWGMASEASNWTKLHHPTNGEQGTWGRANNTYECPKDQHNVDHPLARVINGVVFRVNKGSSPSANSLESRFNKKLKQAAGKPQQFGPLCTIIGNTMQNLTRQCAMDLGFSVVPDFFGRCQPLASVRKTGRKERIATTRGYRQMFETALSHASRQHFVDHYFKIDVQGDNFASKTGRTAEYIVASDRTHKLIESMLQFYKKPNSEKETARILKTLRDNWIEFIADPKAYVAKLRAEAQEWDGAKAAEHFQRSKFPGGPWRNTPWQVHQIVVDDVLYLSQAFFRVIPLQPLPPTDADRVMNEVWRRTKGTSDPWDTDIRYYECVHCNQYSKGAYCTHVAAVTLMEKILPDIPRTFQNCGFIKQLKRDNQYTDTFIAGLPTKYNVPTVQNSPMKESQRFSGQKKGRR